MTYFSVIIPTYNRGHLIQETIGSVLQQSFTSFEVIIVDDGSQDDTEQQVRAHFSENLQVRYFKKNNEERGAARNYGMAQATGEFAVFFDSDDLMKEDYLQTLYQTILKHPDIHFLACKYDFFDRDGNIKPAPIQSVKEGWYDRSFFLKGNILAANYCIRIKGHTCQPFPPQRELASMEDWLFILLNTEQDKVFIRDKVCLSMRQHDERSMGDNQKVIAARIRAVDWINRAIALQPAEKRSLIAWSHYFCGIHQYLDGKRSNSIQEALRAIRKGGVHKKFILLLLKSIVGRKFIQKIK